jgi:EAL domain-containing protein (putative c-di-GMP-specific phosphodiesterase class I)
VSLPLFLEGTELRPSISIGVHVTDVPGPWDELMADADIGLYAAKAAGRDTVRQYEPEMRTIETHARRRRGELVTAVGTDQLVVHYQPIVELRDGAAPAMEALVRWQHPIEGLLAPGDFLPFADRHNLMRVIDRQVMLRALGDLVRARRARPELEQVWVNLSVQSLVDPELVDFVAESLAGADVAPSRLVVEITEEVMLVEGSTSVRTLSRLSELGVGLAVDDFGTGYSSLAQLGALPLTAVKLDRSLIARREGGALLSSIVGVVEALGLRSVAEGVETPEQLAQVAAAGCTFAQGYGLARPTGLDQLIDGD